MKAALSWTEGMFSPSSAQTSDVYPCGIIASAPQPPCTASVCLLRHKCMCFLRSLLLKLSQSRKPFCKSAAVLTFPKSVFRWLTKDKALYFLLCEGSHDKGRVSPPPTKRGTRPAPKPGSVMAVNKNPFNFQPLSRDFYLFLEQYLFVFVMSGSIFIVVKIILPLNVNFIRISLILNSMTVVKHTRVAQSAVAQ